MKVEGQVRIPSGCAIAAVISREGNRMSGELIYNAMKPMHDRSNGLVGEKDDKVYIASEEAAIRTMEPNAENIWVPAGGESVIIKVKDGAY